MSHQTLAVLQSLRLVHAEGGSKEVVHTVKIQIHNALTAGTLSYITSEPYRLAVLQLGNGSFFQLLDRQVYIFYLAAFQNIAQILDAVAAIVGLVFGGRVDDADVLIQIQANVLLIECLRSQVQIPVEVFIFITVLEIKSLWRFSKADAEHVVNGLHHFILHGTKLGIGFAIFVRFS